MLPALHKRQSGVVLHLNPCYGLRTWQLLKLDLQVASASPIYGMYAENGSSAHRSRLGEGTGSATTLR